MNNTDVIIFTKMGKAIRISNDQFIRQNRAGLGITAVKLEKDDEVVAVISV